MKLAVMQPYLFPYIGYFQLIKAVDKFVILDDVNFINRGWINRNRILVNGKAHLFTIPLQEASQHKLIKDIEILNEENWRKKLLRTIEMNYKKAPYFSYIFPMITEIIFTEVKSISKFIGQSISEINNYLSIGTLIQNTSTIYNNSHLKGQDRIIDICKKEQADRYINPIGGTELYSKENFSNAGIDLNFLNPKLVTYKQFNNEFIPWLSIIDVLMFNTKEKVSQYLYCYELL